MASTQKDYLRISGFERNFGCSSIDSLYGYIGLTSQEQAVADTAIFQRLKRIKQLGAASEFYSGATHSRFEHSFGTLYITWTMFKRFVDNVQKHNTWVDKGTILSLFPDDTIKALRISALIHDLGHGPFSHYFEGITDYLEAKVDHDIITPFFLIDSKQAQSRCSSYYNAINQNVNLAEKFKTMQEEFFSCFPEVSIREKVIGIIKPEWSTIEDRDFGKVKWFLHDIIYGDVGSDRIDYLLRDTHYTGLGHRFNLLDLLNNITSIYDSKKDKLRFALTYEGEDVLDFFLTTRYYHYRLIANDLRNIDLYCKLRERVKEGLGSQQNKLSKFIEMTLGDEIDFEKAIPQLSKWDFERVGSWNLGQIRADYYRFLVYRLLTGENQVKKYLVAIQKKLCDDSNKTGEPKLNSEDLRIESVIEKPRIPIISVYRKKYVESKKYPQEENLLSTLVHEDSEMVFGLARTYLAHSSLTLYSRKQFTKKIKDFTSETLSFFVDESLFSSILSFDKKDDLTRLDIMLFCLYYFLAKGGDEKENIKDAPKPNKTPVISSLNKLYIQIKGMQALLEIEPNAKNQYFFEKGEGYEPEQNQPYDCPPAVINDLMLFEYAGLIKITKRNKWINRWDTKAIHKYAIAYEISYPKLAIDNFENILKCYGFYFNKLQEKLNLK